MIAGKIEVEISGVYAKLETDLKAAAATAKPAGQMAGQNFAQGFEKSSDAVMNRHIAAIKAKLIAATGALAITNSLSASLQAGAEGADIGTALAAGVKSLPLVGSIYTIFESIGAIMTDRVGKQAKIMAEEVATKAREEAFKEKNRLKNESDNALAGRKNDNTELRGQRNIQLATQEGDLRKIAAKKAELEIYQSTRKTNADLQTAKSGAEKDEIRKRQAMEFEMIRSKIAFEYKEIEERERKLAQEKLAADTERYNEETKKIMDIEREKTLALDEQRKSVMTAVGSTNTSFGTFKFAEYSPTEKKDIDRQIVSELKAIKEASQRMMTAGGFN